MRPGQMTNVAALSAIIVQAPLTAGPDALGSVSTPSAGVYRGTKNSGGAAFNCGFYGPLRTGDFRYQVTLAALIDLFIGANPTPAASAGFADIPTAVYAHGDGKLESYASGVAGSIVGTYVAGDNLWIDRTGTTVTYKQGATYAGASTLFTVLSVSGSRGVDFSLVQVGASFDVQVAV